MQPRDHRVAGRTASTLGLVAAAVTLVFAAGQLVGDAAGVIDIVVTVVAAALIVVAGLAARLLGDAHPSVWAIWPFSAIGLIVALDFLTDDATLSAQVFLIFPALYAASELRRPGAVVMVVAVLLAEWSVTTVMLPWERAIVEASYMSAAIIATAALLTLAGERQERLISLLERQAAIDPLTGLVTRRVLDEAASSALTGAASAEGTALILIDVDNFKAINDLYGHPGGDEVLVQLADVLIRGSRSTDVVSRLGGDEIALLLPGCSKEVLAARAEQILSEIRARHFVVADGRRVTVTVSGGLAHAPTDAVDLRSMYAAADKALYRAKERGRNQIYAARVTVDGSTTDGSTTDQPADESADLSTWAHLPVSIDSVGWKPRRGESHP
jgi:diguanylate cyclase (GGDEF)-like protein